MGCHLTPLELTPWKDLMQPAHTELLARHVKMHTPCPAHSWASAFCTY